MSGGSLNYLYNREPNELFDYVHEMEQVEDELIRQGAEDVAKDVRRLIEYVKSAEVRISVLLEQLEDIFHAVEWYHSADYGKTTLQEHIEQYRTGKKEAQR